MASKNEHPGFRKMDAYHEAGHVVANVAAGNGAAEWATIVTDESKGYAGRVVLRIDSNLRMLQAVAGSRHARAFVQRAVRVLFAGEAAKDIMGGDSTPTDIWEQICDLEPGAGNASDLQAALDLARGLYKHEARALRFLAEQDQFVRDWLNGHWEYVEVVARALLRHGTIDVHEVFAGRAWSRLPLISVWPVASFQTLMNHQNRELRARRSEGGG